MDRKRVKTPVVTDGVVDTLELARQAGERVPRDENQTPIHACGNASHRLCGCGTCTDKNCQACFAATY